MDLFSACLLHARFLDNASTSSVLTVTYRQGPLARSPKQSLQIRARHDIQPVDVRTTAPAIACRPETCVVVSGPDRLDQVGHYFQRARRQGVAERAHASLHKLPGFGDFESGALDGVQVLVLTAVLCSGLKSGCGLHHGVCGVGWSSSWRPACHYWQRCGPWADVMCPGYALCR